MQANQAISTAIKVLEPIAAEADAKPLHWVCGGDEGLNYCDVCAEKKAAQLKAENPEGNYDVGGGWGGNEEDGCAHCETCGTLLGYSLTDYGRDSELDHYARHMKRKGGMPPDEAYHLVTMLYGFMGSSDRRQVARAAKVADRAIKLSQQA
jgi:hypothetical protein